MPLTEDFIKEHGLNETQAKAIEETLSSEVAEVKKEFDGKANKDAEAIIDGAVKKTIEITGIQRDQGEKAAVYLERVGPLYLTGKLESERKKLVETQTSLEEKLRNSKPSEIITAQLTETKEKLDALLKKEAEFDRIVEAGYETKFTELAQENEKLMKGIAFGKVKPTFPDTANEFEVKAKWNEFESGVLKDWNLEFDENHEPFCISKENKHKTVKLADLVEKDEKLAALRQGRKLKGPGVNTDVTMITIADVPFQVPAKATPEQRSAAIKEYITKELNIPFLAPSFATEFAKWNKILLQGTAS